MSVTARVAPISSRVMVDLLADLSPERQADQFAAFVRSDIAAVGRRNAEALGHPTPVQTYVDGARDDALARVRAGSRVVAEFELGTGVVEWVLDQLQQHSPVGGAGDPHPGLYRRSHLLFADGRQVDAYDPAAKVDEWIITDPLPYARKIERGLSKQTPAGVYEAVSALAATRFSKIAAVKFTFRAMSEMASAEPSGPAGPVLRGAGGRFAKGSHVRPGAAARRRAQANLRQPAIYIRFY